MEKNFEDVRENIKIGISTEPPQVEVLKEASDNLEIVIQLMADEGMLSELLEGSLEESDGARFRPWIN